MPSAGRRRQPSTPGTVKRSFTIGGYGHLVDDIDLRDLRMLLVCAEELHFGRAADRQSVTPARVSQTVAKLERQLGGRLFDRTSRRVVLTPFGAQVIRTVRPAYQGLLEAVRAVTQPRTGVDGTLRVGLLGLGWGTALNPLLVEFRAGNPRCQVVIVDLALDEPINRLAAGDVDVLATFLPLDVAGIAVGPIISRTPRSVLLATDHPLATLPAVHWDDVADYGVADPTGLPEQIKAIVTPPTTPSGRPLKRLLRVKTLTEVFVGVANGQIVHPTVSTFADYMNYPGITARPIVDADTMESAVIYRNKLLDGPVAAFLDVAQTFAHGDEPPRLL